MTLHLKTILLFIYIICTLLACKGQINSTEQQTTQEVTNTALQLDNQIWEIFQDSKGNYWYGSNGRGVYRYDGNQLTLLTTDDGLVGNAIRGIQEDTHNNIYFETTEGISKYDGDTFTTLHPTNSIVGEWKIEPNDLWFGYDANDLYRYDGENLYELKLPGQDLYLAFGKDTFGDPFNANNNSPYAVYGVDKDNDGNVWFGTITAGAFRYDGKSFLWFNEKELTTLPDGRVPGVRSMIQDNDGYFWLSNFYSKYKINPDSPKGYDKLKAVEHLDGIIKDKLPYFNSGITDKKGNLWMTTYGGGVWKYDGKVLSNYDIHNGKETVLLICIYEDKDGVIWVGSDNDGVYRRNFEQFEKFHP